MEPITTAAALVSIATVARPVVKKGVDLIESLLGEPCEIAGSMLADKLYMWQWMNRVKWAARAKEIMDKEGVATRVVPPGFILPLLEAAGNVDEPSVQEILARLLASGTADDRNQHPAFADIARRFSPADVRMLEQFARLPQDGTIEFDRTAPSEELRAAERLHGFGLVDLVRFTSRPDVLVGDLNGLGAQFAAVGFAQTQP